MSHNSVRTSLFPSKTIFLAFFPAPPPSNYEPIVKIAEAKGFYLDVNSNKGLATTLGDCEVPGFPFFNVMLRILATRCMMQVCIYSDARCRSTQVRLYLLSHGAPLGGGGLNKSIIVDILSVKFLCLLGNIIGG